MGKFRMIYFLYLDAVAFCDVFEFLNRRKEEKRALQSSRTKAASKSRNENKLQFALLQHQQSSTTTKKNERNNKQKQPENKNAGRQAAQQTQCCTAFLLFSLSTKRFLSLLLCLHKASISTTLMAIVRHHLCLHILSYTSFIIRLDAHARAHTSIM